MKTIKIVTAAVAAVALCGYAAADVVDAVPGVWTRDPAPPTPVPLPIPPGGDGAHAAPAALGAVENTAPMPKAAAIAGQLDPILAGGEGGLGSSYGVVVHDALTGKELYAASGDKPIEPASVVKILTGFAAVKQLGPDHRFTTSTSLTGGNTLLLVGGGDVLLGAGENQLGKANGHAGLHTLAKDTAAALKTQGVTSVSLALADQKFSGPVKPDGWDQADITNGFAAPITSVAVNAGRLTDFKYAKRHADPGMAATTTFAELLGKEGITVTGDPTRFDGSLGDPEPLATVQSARVADVVSYVLRSSDNTAAEALARHVSLARGGGTNAAEAASQILAVIDEAGVATTGAKLADGSGLSDGSLLPANLVTNVLALAASPQGDQTRAVVSGLPVARVQGTLADRFADMPDAWGVARAKTGTLTGVTALAGVVRNPEGRLLVFTVLADQVPTTEGGRKASDELITALAACECAAG